MRRLLVPLAGIALFHGCSAPDSGFDDTTTVERADLGSTWPLTVDSALLACNNGVVAINVAGRVTIIDQDTRMRGVSGKFIDIWARDESEPTGRMDLTPLMEYGQTLCD